MLTEMLVGLMRINQKIHSIYHTTNFFVVKSQMKQIVRKRFRQTSTRGTRRTEGRNN